MSNFGSFILGFLSFPIFLVLIFLVWQFLLKRTAKELSNSAALATELNTLLINKRKKMLVVMVKENRIELLITKKIHINHEITFKLGMQFNEKNRIYFDKIKNMFETGNHNFKINYTPKLHLPKRIYINYKKFTENDLVILSELIFYITKTIIRNDDSTILTEFCESMFWKN